MDAGDGRLADAGLPQTGVDAGGLGPGADDADIGVFAPQHLLLYGEIVAVAVGHHHHIVLFADGHRLRHPVQIAADHRIGRGEALLGHQLRAVVHHRDPKAHRGQQGTQGQRAVASTEQDGPLTDGQGQGNVGAVRLRDIPQRRRAAVQRQHQRARLPEGNPLQHTARQFPPHRIAGGDELQVHRHVAAAHHADVLAVVVTELVFVDGAAPLPQQRPSQSDGAALHRAAADGAGQQAGVAHQHLRPLAPRGGAAVGNDGAQHRVVVLFHFIEQSGEYTVHRRLLSSPAVYAGRAGAKSYRPRELATRASYCSRVRSQ